jgi:heavy metal sensor kinase
MSQTIRMRLALWYTVSFTFIIGAVAWVSYASTETTLSNRLDQSLTDEMHWLANRLDHALSRREAMSVVVDDIADHVSISPVKEYVEIWQAGDSLFYRSHDLGDDTLRTYYPAISSRAAPVIYRGHPLRLYRADTARWRIYLAMPLESVAAPLHQMLILFFWLCPFVLLAAVGTGLAVAGRPLRQLHQVAETARQITADRLHDRIPEPHTADEIGQIVSTFNEMISRLEVSFGQIRQFSADASHELKTPLTILRSQLERGLNERIGPDELKQIVAGCLDETLRMSAIVDDLLLLAKGDAGTTSVKKERIDLGGMINELYEEAILLASPKSISVTMERAPEIYIDGDRQLLRQMFLNLIDNAIKYNRIGGSIHLSLTPRSSGVIVTFRDAGIGIAAEDIPRIFDRFYRVDRARSREVGGSGLGLSIAKWIASAHGGSISVRSIVNEMTEFSVTLPGAPPAT